MDKHVQIDPNELAMEISDAGYASGKDADADV